MWCASEAGSMKPATRAGSRQRRAKAWDHWRDTNVGAGWMERAQVGLR
jgi:hypothetical protein